MIKIKYIRTQLKEYDELVLFPLGDVHYGSASADTDEFKRYLELAGSMDNARIILMGDLVEMAGRQSPGKGLFEQAQTPDEQIDWMSETFEPYIDKIILSHSGNHEARTTKQTGIDIMKMFCRLIKVPYIEHSSVTRINLAERSFSIFSYHGSGTGKLPTLKLRRLRDIVTFVHDCDIYLSGHHHSNIHEYMQVKRLDHRNKTVIDTEALLCMTGAFLGYNESYAEEVMMSPTIIGAPILVLNKDGVKVRQIDDFTREA